MEVVNVERNPMLVADIVAPAGLPVTGQAWTARHVGRDMLTVAGQLLGRDRPGVRRDSYRRARH